MKQGKKVILFLKTLIFFLIEKNPGILLGKMVDDSREMPERVSR